MCLTACFCAFFSLFGLIAYRYVYVCHRDLRDRLFSRNFFLGFCVLAWAVAFSLELPNFLGWGGHFYDRKNHSCIWNRMASRSYTMFVTVGLMVVPLCTMVVANGRISWVVMRAKLKVHANQTMSANGIDAADRNKLPNIVVSVISSHQEEEDDQSVAQLPQLKEWLAVMQTCRSLIIVTMAYVICWTPYIILLLTDSDDSAPLNYISGSRGWRTFIPPSMRSFTTIQTSPLR